MMLPAGIDEQKLRRAFLEESEELLEHLGEHLLEIEKNPTDRESVNEVFRIMHSLKSESAVMGFEALSEVAHTLEDVFSQVRDGALALDQTVVDVVLAGTDLVHEMMASISRGGRDSDFDINDVLAGVRGVLKVETQGEAPSARAVSHELSPGDLSDRERLQLAEALDRGEHFVRLDFAIDNDAPMKYPRAYLVFSNLERSANVVRTVPSMQEGAYDDDQYRRVTVYLTTEAQDDDIRETADIDQVEDVEISTLDLGEYVRKPESRRKPAQGPVEERTRRTTVEKSSIRVEMRKLDDFWRLIGELILARSTLSEVCESFPELEHLQPVKDRLRAVVDSVETISQGLQQTMMATRMVPIAVLFNRFPRFVRDLSRILGKDVEIRLEGQETEIDRSIIEEISDPLTHIIRNCLDHGIEFPEERVRLGKSKKGLVTMTARHAGSSIVMEIADDGKGLDLEKIRTKAIGTGLLDQTVVDEDMIINCIFAPGFSTKEEVTDLSGRGVGMDVVGTRIRDTLRGDVVARSDPGKGTRFSIVLPIDLNIVNALMVRSGGYLYGIPVSSIEETAKLSPGDFAREGLRATYVQRDRAIPVYVLNELLEQDGAGDRDEYYCVIVSHADRSACLVVDEFIEEQEIVIKPIDEIINYRRLFSGVAVMGNGVVAYIIDAAFLDNPWLAAFAGETGG